VKPAGIERVVALGASNLTRGLHLNPDWYGFDPIHIRPSLWRVAWQEILGSGLSTGADGLSLLEGIKLYFKPPERQWLFGVERLNPQSNSALTSAGGVSLY
jgi:hypothetical protein